MAEGSYQRNLMPEQGVKAFQGVKMVDLLDGHTIFLYDIV